MQKARLVVSFSLDYDTYLVIREQSEKTNRSFSELLRALIHSALEAQSTRREALHAK